MSRANKAGNSTNSDPIKQ